jgi:hypothetical protein
MNKRSLLAGVVITVCFLIGFLTYSATVLFVDFLKSQVETCDKRDNHCHEREQYVLKY